MVFGINVSGELGALPGELDTWVRTESLAEVTGSSRVKVEQALQKEFSPITVPGWDFVIRLKSRDEAEKLVHLLEFLAHGTSTV